MARASHHPSLQLVVVVAAWLAVFRVPLTRAIAAHPGESLRINAILLAGLLAVVAVRSRGVAIRPVLRRAPLLVVASALGVHLWMACSLRIHLVSCTAMVFGGWGLAGLYLTPARWRQAFPLMIAGLCVLPLSAVLDVLIGFPLRLATAGIVQGLAGAIGLGDVTAQTIVVLDGAGVQIDVPCSGVRSLWSGAIFWTAASWLERRRIGLAWLGASVAFVAALVVANGLRVVAMVALHGLGLSTAAELVHLPLGLASFGAAVASGWLLLQRVPKARLLDEPGHATPRPVWLLCGILAGLAALPCGTAPATASIEPLVLHDDALDPVATSPEEAELFATRGAEAAGKWDLAEGSLHGQVVIVTSRSWRAQHRPDVCHQAHGRRVADEAPILVAPALPARRLSLTADGRSATALYWFQSADRTTNEYGARVWAGLTTPDAWALVSVLVDGDRSVDDPELRALLLRLHDQTATLLERSPR